MTEFVEDWCILHTLGEGAFGEVKLLLHSETGDTVAVKIIDYTQHKDATESVKKEICIHRLLTHPNIIKYYGRRKEELREYIFLEYAAGGELFNKIEPDIGMPNWDAQKYFKQLLLGIEYLHGKGIAHRDIKPENLLLDHNGNLKITDFGMATIFRLRGQERLLEKRCGTLPYLAPEVLEKPYQAQPADIWSCGIVLVAMLAGELPWDSPCISNVEYKTWVEGLKYMLLSPWKKLDNMALSLIRCILNPIPKERFTLEKINKHRWLHFVFPKTHFANKNILQEKPQSAQRLHSNDNISSNKKVLLDEKIIGLSQPLPQKENINQIESLMHDKDLRENICFSQPVQFDDLIVNSQIQFTQFPITKNNFQKLVSRMTRFFVTTDYENTLQILCKELEEHGYTWHTQSPGMVSISTVDNHKMQLVFKANIINMDDKLLLDFRLSKGCGLQFKKRFLQLKTCLKDIVAIDEKIE